MNSVLRFRTPEELRSYAEQVRCRGGKVGLVPTMGALHEGHLSLIRIAKALASDVIVTIFVNPTQFGPREDLAAYPRTLERDIALATEAGATAFFVPDVGAMYPGSDNVRVVVRGLTEGLCGASRPHHFEGVATIVTKIFAIVGPCVAVFGRKDYQQLQVVRALARELLLPVEIVGAPLIRDVDGLALSSRNAYLSQLERAKALAIPRALSNALRMFVAGERSVSVLDEVVRGGLERSLLAVDYVTFADPDTLAPCVAGKLGERALLAVAAFAGTTRLIDNVLLGEEGFFEVAPNSSSRAE